GKEIALAIDPEYYEKLWVCSHESCPDWMQPPDLSAADCYMGNGYFPSWCADVVWMQLEADILGRPVMTLQATEGASFGAALLGAKAAGLIKDPEAHAKELAKAARVYEPEARRHAAYRRRFELYRRIYDANRDLLHELDRLAKEGR
ncbi:MAG: hypothetical protein GYA73_08625, partial [Planctomycetes bacterium]|nr:hypothetical protein [Planctomycetota bacterium]